MSLNTHYFRKKFILCLFCVVSFSGVISGMSLCLTKSPETQADIHLALANQYIEQAKTDNKGADHLLKLSETMALAAISYVPYNAEVQQKFSFIYRQQQALIDVIQDKNLEQDLALFILK